MADEDYGEDDAFFFDDDDYLYVEDDYAIATQNRLPASTAREAAATHTRDARTTSYPDAQDELAETQIPSPGYAGVNDEIANESFEYDVYEYFGELEYGSDSYWDARIKHLADARAGEKRKVGVDECEAAAVKKRRTDAGLEAKDNVVFMPFDARLPPLPPRVHDEGTFALLPDWKERFPERAEEESPARVKKYMPADMRRAAEAKDEESDEECEDEARGEQMVLDSEEDDEGDGAAGGIDHDVIMQVLRQKLADSGLEGVDESVFKDAIAKMLSGEGDEEDALGGLTSLLLEQKDGGGKAFQGFLAGHGVEMGHAEDDEVEEEEQDDEKNDPEDQAQADEPHVSDSESAQTVETTATPTTTLASTSTTRPSHRTPTTRGKSKVDRRATTTATTIATPDAKTKPTSPIVVPSPPPVLFKTSLKRKAPSLDEPALPQPEAPCESAKPAAKRRRAVRSKTRIDEAKAAPPVVPVTGRRSTRSAAAGGKHGR